MNVAVVVACWNYIPMEIKRDAPIEPKEIEDLRETVGWERSEGTYEEIINRLYTYYTVRNEHDRLVGYMSVLSDGRSNSFLLDLVVHPHYQKKGLGIRIVTRAIADMKAAGIQCVHVTFNEKLESFYSKCGFHIFRGGIIDFKKM